MADVSPTPIPSVTALHTADGALASYPPPERWDDWVEYDARAWPQRVPRRYMLVPTICFNCEAACGLLAYVDRDTMAVAPTANAALSRPESH